MFCVRFLVALCKEREPRRIGYWVRRRLGSGTDTMAELRQSKKQHRELRKLNVRCFPIESKQVD